MVNSALSALYGSLPTPRTTLVGRAGEMRAARALGCRTLGGGGMAVFQAAEAFRLFTGIAPDSERMLRHFAAMGEG